MLKVIYFLSFPSIPKTSEPFELLLELLSVVVFDSELKDDISYMLVSFDEVILLELWCMVDFMTECDLFCKLEIEALIFLE